MEIEVLGTGCAKCQKLEKNARKAVEQLGIDAEIKKIEDIGELSERGVMMTPALAVDGETKVSGEVASPKKIMKILKD